MYFLTPGNERVNPVYFPYRDLSVVTHAALLCETLTAYSCRRSSLPGLWPKRQKSQESVRRLHQEEKLPAQRIGEILWGARGLRMFDWQLGPRGVCHTHNCVQVHRAWQRLQPRKRLQTALQKRQPERWAGTYEVPFVSASDCFLWFITFDRGGRACHPTVDWHAFPLFAVACKGVSQINVESFCLAFGTRRSSHARLGRARESLCSPKFAQQSKVTKEL